MVAWQTKMFQGTSLAKLESIDSEASSPLFSKLLSL